MVLEVGEALAEFKRPSVGQTAVSASWDSSSTHGQNGGSVSDGDSLGPCAWVRDNGQSLTV